MEETRHSRKGLIENLSPRAAFKTGLLSGLGIMFVVGFFILLGLMLTKNSNGAVAVNSGTNNNGNTAAVAGNNAAAGINIKPVDKNNDWIKGNKNAKVSIVEFSDLECPFCKKFNDTTTQILQTYGDKVNLVFRHFPLPSLHSKAPKEAEASECAGEQGGNDAFWAFVDRLFAITPSNNGLAESQLGDIAQYIGLDVNKFQTCLDSGKYAIKVQDQSQQAQAAGGRGTPYSVILVGDQKIPINGALPFETIKSMLDQVVS